MKQTISVVISAYNEEEKIKDCLESVKWADEIIFVDNTSQDKTVDIAKKYTTKIFKRENNLMLNVNKNYGFSKATSDWILSLDADEHVTPELREEIEQVLSKGSQAEGYLISRKNIIFGKWIQHSIWWPDYQLRLFKKGKGKFEELHVHELIKVEGEVEKLQEPLIHENYSSASQYLYKLDHIYTENEAQSFIKAGKKLHWIDAIRFPVGDFLKTFFLQKGYKDGLHGLVLSILQAFYTEVVFLKIWEKEGFKETNNENFLKEVIKEFTKAYFEFKYWILTSYINESKNSFKTFFYKIQRRIVKLKIK